MDIYKENGFDSRKKYLESVADDYGIDIDMVLAAADMLGPNEDFDGLITMLEDFVM